MKNSRRTAWCFIISMIVLGLVAPMARGQHANDVELSRPTLNGPIATSGGDYQGQYAGRVFEGIMPSLASQGTTSPGFDSQVGTFPAHASIRFDFVKQLLYWNGVALTTPSAALTVSGSSTVTIGGNDTAGLLGFVIASADQNGAFHSHALNYSLPDDAPAGLYGLVMTLGPGPGATGFTTSDSFMVAFSRGTFSDPAGGLDAMVDVAFAPVPEPSTWVLCGIGIATAAWQASRRKNRLQGGSKPV